MLKLLFFAAGIAALIHFGSAAGQGATKPQAGGSRRSWKSVQCNPTQLAKFTQSQGKSKKASALKRAAAQWNALSATVKANIEKALKASSWAGLSADDFAKIPADCLANVALDGVKLVHLEKLIELGDEDTAADAVAKLSAADKTQLLTKILATPTLASNEMLVSIGPALLTDILAKVAKVPCSLLFGAMNSPALTAAQFEILNAHAANKNCFDSMPRGICTAVAARAIVLYKGTKDQKTLVTKLSNLYRCMDERQCWKVARGFMAAFKVAQSTIDLDLESIPWGVSKCPSKRKPGFPCRLLIAKMFSRGNCKDQTVQGYLALGTGIGALVSRNCIKNLWTKGGDCKALKPLEALKAAGKAFSEQRKDMIDDCAKKLGVKDGTTLDTPAKVVALDAFVLFLPWGILKKIPAICDKATVLPKIAWAVQYLPDWKRAFLQKKCKWPAKDIPKQERCDAGSGRRGGGKKNPTKTKDEVKKMTNAEALAACTDANALADVGEQYDALKCQIVKKSAAADRNSLKTICKDENLCRCLSKGEMASFVSAFKDIMKLKDVKMTRAQQSDLLKKLISLKAMDQWTAKDLKQVAKVLPKAFRPKHIKDLATKLNIWEIVKAFKENVADLRGKTMNTILDSVEEAVAARATDETVNPWTLLLTKEAAALGDLLGYVAVSFINKNPNNGVLEKWCEGLIKRFDLSTTSQCTRIVKKGETTDDYYNTCAKVVVTSGSPTVEDYQALGLLLCFMPPGILAKLTGEDASTLAMNGGPFGRCPWLPPGLAKGLLDKLFNKNGNRALAQLTEDELLALAPLIRFDLSRLTKVPKGLLFRFIKAAMVNTGMSKEKLECLGQKFNVKFADFPPGLAKVLAKQTRDTDPADLVPVSRRRKRSTTYKYTSDFLSGQSDIYIVALFEVVGDIDKISDADFKDLIVKFGNTFGWNSAQLEKLATKAKTALGKDSFCKLTLDEIKTCGNINTGMTLVEIECMTGLTEKGVALASRTTWSNDKLVKLAAKYVTQLSLAASTLTDQQMRELGSFMGGLPDADILKIPTASFKAAIATVQSKYVNFPQAKLAVLLQLAIKSYGALDTWDVATIQAVGCVMAGMNAAQMKSLGDKAASIDGTYLKMMSKDVLAGMTDEAKNALDPDLKEELFPTSSSGGGGGSGTVGDGGDGGDGGGGKNDDGNSAAAAPFLNGLLMLTTLVIAVRQA